MDIIIFLKRYLIIGAIVEAAVYSLIFKSVKHFEQTGTHRIDELENFPEESKKLAKSYVEYLTDASIPDLICEIIFSILIWPVDLIGIITR